MSLKLSPGCTCCSDPDPPTSECDICSTASPPLETIPAEYDVTLAGFANHASGYCTGCPDLDDTYTLQHMETPPVGTGCAWKFTTTEPSATNGAACNGWDPPTVVFIDYILLTVSNRTLEWTDERVFQWKIEIATNGGDLYDPFGAWFSDYNISNPSYAESTPCNITHLFEYLSEESSAVAPLCIAVWGTTTADIEVG